jgi:hypothetical protein
MRMSVVGMSERSTEREEGDFRASAMEDLWVVRRSDDGIREGRLTRRTEAP